MRMGNMSWCTLRCVHIAAHAGWLGCLLRPTQHESTRLTITPAWKEITHTQSSGFSSHTQATAALRQSKPAFASC